MTDLLQSAKLFDVSARLQTASTYLKKYATTGGGLDESATEALKWTGTFLVEVDWTSGKKSEIEGGMAVSATNTRPKFYASLMKIGQKFRELGINSEDEINAFLKLLYDFLLSGGKSLKEINKEKLILASKLLNVLSQSIIVDLTNNGLPKRRTVFSIESAL